MKRHVWYVGAVALLGIALFFLGNANDSLFAAKETKKQNSRTGVQIKKTFPKNRANTIAGKKMNSSNAGGKKMETVKKSLKKSKTHAPQAEKRMRSEMTKKGPVNIKKDELIKLREQNATKKNDAILKKGGIKIEKQAMPQKSPTPPESSSQETLYAGTLLAGSQAKLLDFTKADYDAAVQSDKLIILYFYANWCPICKAEFPKMQEAFNEIASDKIVGFRINYNDNETDDTERALAREFGIAYQHTKVVLKNGERVLKSPESWEKERYLSEITARLSQ